MRLSIESGGDVRTNDGGEIPSSSSFDDLLKNGQGVLRRMKVEDDGADLDDNIDDEDEGAETLDGLHKRRGHSGDDELDIMPSIRLTVLWIMSSGRGR